MAAVRGPLRRWLGRGGLSVRDLADIDAYAVAQGVDASGLAARAAAGEPLEYVLEHTEFAGLKFACNRDVLIPRADSEPVLRATLAAMELVASTKRASDGEEEPSLRVLDLGTGSGCLLLAALTGGTPGTRGVGVDVSDAALSVAKANGQALGLDHRVQWLQGSWWQALAPPASSSSSVSSASSSLSSCSQPLQFDVVVSNPPYLGDAEMAALPASVAGFEPPGALDGGGEHGLDAYRAILRGIEQHLVPGGRLCLELGVAPEDVRAEHQDAASEDGWTWSTLHDVCARDTPPQLLRGRQVLEMLAKEAPTMCLESVWFDTAGYERALQLHRVKSTP